MTIRLKARCPPLPKACNPPSWMGLGGFLLPLPPRRIFVRPPLLARRKFHHLRLRRLPPPENELTLTIVALFPLPPFPPLFCCFESWCAPSCAVSVLVLCCFHSIRFFLLPPVLLDCLAPRFFTPRSPSWVLGIQIPPREPIL